MENFSNYFVSITKFVVEYFVIFLDLFDRKNEEDFLLYDTSKLNYHIAEQTE